MLETTNAARYLNSKQIEQVQKAFQIFDQDKSGSISIRQFDQILKSLGQTLPQQQLQIIIQKIDKDGNGFIDFQEFLQLVAPKIIMNRSQKEYVETFKLIDQKNDGLIDRQELLRANLIVGNPLKQIQIDQIIQFVRTKYKGNFDLMTVLKMMLRRPLI